MRKTIFWVINIIFIILAIILIIQLILKLTGNSPTTDQIMITAIGLLIVNAIRTAVFEGQVKEYMKTSKNTFKKISEDLQNLKSIL